MKKKLFHAITLRQLRNVIGNSRIVHKFADRHDLVYFGTVHQDDESRLVQGLTISNSHKDSHYCVGTVFGRDLIFVQRADRLYDSRTKSFEQFFWNILTLDMNDATELPHMYIEGKYRHTSGFYEMLAMKKREFAELPQHFLGEYDRAFTHKYVCRMSAANAASFSSLLRPDLAAVIAHHFSAFDYEWHDDVLYVYYLSRQPSLEKLDLQLKAGVWLASELEYRAETDSGSEN